MARSQTITTERVGKARSDAVRLTKEVLRDLFGPPQMRRFGVRLWDGTWEGPQGYVRAVAHEGAVGVAHHVRPVPAVGFTLVLKRPGALRRMFLPPSELAISEAYLRDDFDVEGSMEAATGLADNLASQLRSPLTMMRLFAKLRELPSDDLADDGVRSTAHAAATQSKLNGTRHSRSRDAAAVRSHYDVGNDFYALWLDQRMVYSCAYFAEGVTDLDTAQIAKLEYICRKLRLKPGERLLDIGCGWGGLAIYAAQQYGVEVTGITLSKPQAELARRRISEAGLDDHCRIEVRDYRELPKGITFDKVVSVGMFEHVGRPKLPTYFAEAYRLTAPGGLFLNHGIVALPTSAAGRDGGVVGWATRKLWREGAFIERYVFPDAELVAPGEVIARAEAVGFETRDVESLREHYALTLREWVKRLEANRETAVAMVGEKTYRIWRIYMAACARAFSTGGIGIIQALFTKPDRVGVTQLPPTRDDLYRTPLI